MSKKSKKSKRTKAFEESVIRTYFETLTSMLCGDRQCLGMTTDGRIFDHTEDDKWAAVAKMGVPMREARIFAIQPEQYVEFYHAADVYTTEKIAGLKWLPPNTTEVMPAGDIPLHYDRISKAGERISLPPHERWPFPSMWIGFGELNMSPLQISVRTDRSFLDKLGAEGAGLAGLLIFTDENGNDCVSEVYYINCDQPMMMWRYCYKGGRWDLPYDLNPWIVNAIMGYIEDAGRTFIETMPSANARYNRKVMQKRQTVVLPAPKPYYVINVHPKMIQERATKRMAEVSKKFEYTYRFDVSGHERVRYCRGSLPMDPDMKATLLAKGYHVYEGVSPDGRDLYLLMERGITVDHDRWLAMKVSQVKPHMKGPEDKPYVPAIRKL
jgi:hypothetical protein